VKHSVEDVFSGLGLIALLVFKGQQVIDGVSFSQVESFIIDKDSIVLDEIFPSFQVLYFAFLPFDSYSECDQLGALVMGHFNRQLIWSEYLKLGFD